MDTKETTQTGIEDEDQEPEVKTNKHKAMASTVVGSKGQIVIPKIIRDMFDIKPGDRVVVLADTKRGIAIVKEGFLINLATKSFK
ncbi:MAG: AbrB/MazE/SpoVT family DNA-binding domain-containing protein [Bacilli bacterium]|jgi:AbrB family looped-hinge helix DNA binding protein